MSRVETQRNVLITGASGFVGTWLNRSLRASLPAECKIVSLDQHAGDAAPGLDVTDQIAVEALVKALQPDVVVHLAAISSVSETAEAGRRAWNVNFFGTMNLAQAVLHHAPHARFVFVSSSEIYGTSFNEVSQAIDETVLLAPRSVYAATKAAADLLIGQMAATGLRAVRFRPFNHTGPGQTTRFVVPAFAAQIAAIERGERPPVISVGNLDTKRDFLDVRDVVEAYRLAVTAPSLPNGTILNLASGVPRRISDVLDALLAMSHKNIKVEQATDRLRSNDIPFAIGDSRRAKTTLGWSPQIAWEDTLRDVLEFYRQGWLRRLTDHS